MLFAAPLPPIWIPKTRGLVLGRSPDSDLPVPSKKASRRHAEVRYEGEKVLIEDLGSTNGTRVNGEPVEGTRVLCPGDRIQVGGMTITFCQVEERFDTVNTADQTVAMSMDSLNRDPEAFRGELTEFPAYVILQILESGEKTGLLHVETSAGDVRLWVLNGRPAHAEAKGASGLEAAHRLFGLTQGRFTFDRGTPAPAQTLFGSVTEMLLEYSRICDELENTAAGRA